MIGGPVCHRSMSTVKFPARWVHAKSLNGNGSITTVKVSINGAGEGGEGRGGAGRGTFPPKAAPIPGLPNDLPNKTECQHACILKICVTRRKSLG